MWLAVDLIDDHRPGEVIRHRSLIGIVYGHEGKAPVLVSCFEQDRKFKEDAHYCLNEVANFEHRAHLSRTAVLTVTGADLIRLRERGVLILGGKEDQLVPFASSTVALLQAEKIVRYRDDVVPDRRSEDCPHEGCGGGSCLLKP